jgi:catalase
MFSYPDAARYRLGVNYQQLPTNSTLSPVYSPFQRDGSANFKGNYGPDPNYVRSTLRPLNYGPASVAHDTWAGQVVAFATEVTDEDFVQAKGLWDVLGTQPGQQANFVANISSNLKLAAAEVQVETISECSTPF